MQERRCNKIPSCGSRVLNTFVFLRQRCTWPAPVIPQVFGTSVSDKSPAPGRLPALFSLRQSFRATSTEPPPRFVDSFLRPHSPSFLPLPSSSFFLPLFSFPPPSLPSLSPSVHFISLVSTHRFVARIRKRFVVPKYLRIVLRCNAAINDRRMGRRGKKGKISARYGTVSVEGRRRTGHDATRSGIEFWLFGYGIRRRRIVSETRVTGLWRIADGRWARPIKLIIHLLQPGGKFKLVLKNSPANGLAKRIGFSKLTTPVKLDGRGPPVPPSARITKINIISRSIYPPLSTLRLEYRDQRFSTLCDFVERVFFVGKRIYVILQRLPIFQCVSKTTVEIDDWR